MKTVFMNLKDGMSEAESGLNELSSSNQEFITSCLETDESVEEFSNELVQLEKSSEIAAFALNTLANAMVAIVIKNLGQDIEHLIHKEKYLSEVIQNANDKYRERISTIDNYSSRMRNLYNQINSGQLTLDEHVDANKELYEIQRELINQFGSEAVGFDLVTASIDEQNAALERMNELKTSSLSYAQWLKDIDLPDERQEEQAYWSTKINQIVALGGGLTPFTPLAYENLGIDLNDYSIKEIPELIEDVLNAEVDYRQLSTYSNLEGVMKELEKFENYTAEVSVTTDDALNNILNSYSNITRAGDKFQITGTADQVKSTIIDIQSRLRSYSGYTEAWDSELLTVLGDAEEISNTMRNAYEYNMKFKIDSDPNARDYQTELENAYNEYIKAKTSGDILAAQDSLDKFTSIINEIENSDLDSAVKQYILDPYSSSIDLATEKLETGFERIRKIATQDSNETVGIFDLSDPLVQFYDLINSGKYSYADILALSDEDIKAVYDSIRSAYGNVPIREVLEKALDEFPEITSAIGEQSAETFVDSFTDRFNETTTNSSTPVFSSDSLKEWYKSLSLEEQLQVDLWSDEDWDRFIEGYKESATELNGILDEDRQIWKQYNEEIDQSIDELNELETEALEKGIDLNKTVFGNIDTDNRYLLEWTEENLEKYKDILQEMFDEYNDWDSLKDDLRGSFSTILGSSNEYDGVEIAFSPILQTEDGPVLLSQHTVDEYIWGLIDNAGEGWTTELLLELDAKGLMIDGHLVKGLIADVGETAIETSEAMHYVGATGAIQMAKNAIETFAKSFPPLQNRIKQTGETEEGWLQRVSRPTKQHQKEVDALNQSYKNLNNTLDTEESDPIADISESIRDVNTQLDPFFNSLADLYTVLFEDGVFDFDKIDISKLASLEQQFNNIADDLKAQLGDSFDASIVEKFFSDIKNASNTKDAQDAVNEFATAWFYNTEVMKDLNPETAKYIKRMMELTGIVNADEIVTKALADAENRLIIEEEIANGASLERIQKLLDERSASEALRISLLQSALATEGFNDTTLSVSDKINKLKELAGAYLDTANAARVAAYASTLEAGMKYDSSLTTAKVDQLLQDYVANLSDIKPVEVEWQKYNDTDGASDAGKEEADAYLEAFNAELENLDWLHENGYLTEKEYLDQLRILYERYFEGNDKYAKEFFENQRKYLQGLKDLYDNALSAITNLLDDEIQKYDDLEEKEKKVFEDEKEANNKKIKALEKVNKQLDKQIKALEKEQKAIQKQNIDPIEEQIKGREEAKKVLEEELSLMQKANDERQDAINLQKAQYELERAMHQKVNLVYTDDDGLGGQMRYRADEKNVREQRENLDNLQYELTIKAKQEEIDLVDQEIEKLNDEKQKYQDQIDALSKKIDLLNEQKDANSEIIEDINEQNEALDEQITKIEEEYKKLKDGVEDYKKEWEKIAEYAQKAADAALLSSIGFDPELIKNLDPESLKNFDAIYSSILGSLNANDEEMTDALQNLSGKTLGDYLSSTADGIAALDKLDLSSINTAIQTASSGVLAMNDGFALAAQIIPTISTQLDGVAKSAEGAVAVIGTAISTEKSESNGTLASSISEVGEISDEALGAEEGVQADLIGIQQEAEIATSKVGEIQSALEELTSKTYEVQINVTKTGGDIPQHAKGTVGNAYADGYPGLKTSELALRSEYGQPELTVYPNGSYELTNTPTLSHLPKDTVIFNEEQTRRILKKGGMSGKAYADGNATSSQFRSLAEVMPDKASIFERFNANLQANLEAIKMNALNIANNTAEIARAAVNTFNQSPTVVLNGGINVTCPGVTETEVAKNLGTALSNQLSSIFQGAALRADQWAMRR